MTDDGVLVGKVLIVTGASRGIGHAIARAAGVPVARAWAGLYDMTPDAHPIIGWVSDGVYAACGFSGHGFMQSPAVGRAAAAVGAFFLLLALISPRGMGLGDVKLAPTLGLALGWLSWGTVAVGVFAGFLLGGLAGVGAILLLGLTRKSLLPFGPWLVAGALLGVLAGADVAAWYAHALIGS